jgi:regulator of cell morphogenesis and NO signaling
MNSQKLSDVLKKEHRIIEDIIKILEACAKRLEENKKLDIEILTGSVDLIKNFTHKYHRRKEESVLFKIIGRKTVLWGLGDIAPLLYEHEEGAEYVRSLAGLLTDAIKSGIASKRAKRSVIKNIYGYNALLSSHLLQEEKKLYPLAERILSNQERENVLRSFKMLEDEMITVGDKQRYENLIKDYKKRLDIR